MTDNLNRSLSCTLYLVVKKYLKHVQCFCQVIETQSRGSLGELEMLWKYKLTGEYFHHFFKFPQSSVSVSVYNMIETQRTCFLFCSENFMPKKNCLLLS